MNRILNQIVFISLLILNVSCSTQKKENNLSETQNKSEVVKDEISLFQANHADPTEKSISIGKVNEGKIINACLLPFFGENFSFFSKESYLAKRAFIHCDIKNILISSFTLLKNEIPNRRFYIMEASNEKGGKISPHRTHQNGTSIDLMIPLKKNDMPYTGLDTIGIDHYLLQFNNQGEYSEDISIQIDFDALAQEILSIQTTAVKNDWKINKVILKTELQSLLFKSKYKNELMDSGIYFTKKLENIINDLHDDHIHIDFKKINN